MIRISAFIKSVKETIRFEKALELKLYSFIKIENVTVFWKFKNLQPGNDEYEHNGVDENIESGYWTLDQLIEFFKTKNIEIKYNNHNGTCKVMSTGKTLNLKKFGLLLGFNENTSFLADEWKTSANGVEINQGFRYITINGNIVYSENNFNESGGNTWR